MAIKALWSLVTPHGTNEQTGVNTITVTATGNSREYPEVGQLTAGLVFLDVTAVSGSATPTLTVALQHQDPISGKWQAAVTFPAQTAVTGATPLAPIALDLLALNYRLAWTVSGTSPSFTFSCCVVAGSEEAAP